MYRKRNRVCTEMEVNNATDNSECWPVYMHEFISSLKVLPVPDLAGIVNVPEDKICKSIPQIRITGAEIKASYLLDHSYVPEVDVSTDNLGIWNSKHRSTQTTTFYIKGCDFGGEGDCEYVVRKRRHNHVNAKPLGSVRKVVWTLFKSGGIAFRSLISYRIAEGAEVVLTAHGNARTLKQIYTRTYPSALRRMKELRRTLPPREVLPAMVAEQGSLPGLSITQVLPRNKTQLYSMSRSKIDRSRRRRGGSTDTLMEELLKLSEHAVVESDLISSLEGSVEDPLMTSPHKDSPISSNLAEAAIGVGNVVQQTNSSRAMSLSEFQSQLVDRLSIAPSERRWEIREKINYELEVLFAQSIAARAEECFDESVRGSVMEQLRRWTNWTRKIVT
uniref:FLYWCH-type domain-containing protein n=1 Tax=Parascaris univalens TaxID=6257 RepID=A0A915BEN8_PARUN